MGKRLPTLLLLTSKTGNGGACHRPTTTAIGAFCLPVTQTRIKILSPASICFVTMVLEDVNTV